MTDTLTAPADAPRTDAPIFDAVVAELGDPLADGDDS